VNIYKITLINFRNYREVSVNFSTKFNCFAGNNGTGKTNLLEAIYYLSFCKSFSNPVDTQNIYFDSDFFLIQGTYQINGVQDELHCGVKRQQRKVFRRNKKEYERLSDHIGLYPLVLISPGDANLITGGSDERRKFIDGVISQYNQEYLHHLLSYNKALTMRNALLKMFAERRKFDPDSLELYDELLVQYGEFIFNERWKFFQEFLPVFSEFYGILSGLEEAVNIGYQSTLLEGNYRNQLVDARQSDRLAQYTTLGIHKDDLLFTIHEVPVKRYGSQGQQKTFLIALKLAQHAFTRTIKGFSPILLFDDIFDKLDDLRVEQLMRLVSSSNFGQVFVTDTNFDRLEKLFKTLPGQSHIYLVADGKVALKSTFSN
jgi:DNA replication and repair protein RecF